GRRAGRGLVEGRPPSGGFLRRRRPRRRRRLTGRAGTGRPAAVRVLDGRVLPGPAGVRVGGRGVLGGRRAERRVAARAAGQRRIGVASAAWTPHEVPLPRHVPNGDKILWPPSAWTVRTPVATGS